MTGSTPGGTDPETQKILQQIQKAYPQLGSPQMPGSAPQSPNTLAQMGYGFGGVPLYFGQGSAGQNPFGNVNSLFERSGNVSADSITAALSGGQTGNLYSGVQGPNPQGPPPSGGGLGPGGGGVGQLSTSGYGMAPGTIDYGGGLGGGAAPQTLDLGAITRGATGLYNMFTGGTGQPSGNANAGTNPALALQRQGEQQNLSPAGLPTGQTQGQAGALFQAGGLFAPGAAASGQTTFNTMAPGAGNTVGLPGGPPMPFDPNTVGPPPSVGGLYSPNGGVGGGVGTGNAAPETGGLFGTGVSGTQLLGGVNAAGGLLNLYQGLQNRNPIQALGGGVGALGGASAAFPQTSAALLGSSAPYVGAGLSGIGGGLGIYGGINALQRGDTLGGLTQLGTGAAGLYGGAAGLTNALTGAQTLPTLGDLAAGGLNAAGNFVSGGSIPSLTSSIGDALGIGAGNTSYALAPSLGSAAGGAAAGIAPAVTEEAALLGTSAGAAAGAAGALPGAAAAGPAAIIAMLPALAAMFDLGGTGGSGLGGMWEGAGQGASQATSASRTAAGQAASVSQAQMGQALQAYQHATASGMPTDPAILQQLASQLQGGELSYYQTYPYQAAQGANGIFGGSVGASSNFGPNDNPAAMAPYNQGMAGLQSVIQALQAQGQPFQGLNVPQWQYISGSNNPAWLGGPMQYAPGANRETLQQYGSALAGGDISGTSA